MSQREDSPAVSSGHQRGLAEANKKGQLSFPFLELELRELFETEVRNNHPEGREKGRLILPDDNHLSRRLMFFPPLAIGFRCLAARGNDQESRSCSRLAQCRGAPCSASAKTWDPEYLASLAGSLRPTRPATPSP
jgi:hypothetical protein